MYVLERIFRLALESGLCKEGVIVIEYGGLNRATS